MKAFFYACGMLGINPFLVAALCMGALAAHYLQDDPKKLEKLEKEVKQQRLEEEQKKYKLVENIEHAADLFK